MTKMWQDDQERPETTGELVELLDLEVLDRDLYRAHSARHQPNRHRNHLFGGQVAAQALRAATLTVDEDRYPHSLHGYFLRAGRSDLPTILRVDRDRDGRTVSARRVTALQDGEVIFTLAVSLSVPGTGLEFEIPLPDDTPRPDDLPAAIVPGAHPAFEILPLGPTSELKGGLADHYWARPLEPLPDDALLHAGVLTYLSDMGVGEGSLAPEVSHLLKPSVDHAVWIHRPARMDDWVLVSFEPVSAQAGRLLYRGSFHTLEGSLIASIAQECLLRTRQPRG
jgi:acyl-CoA thioesterase-2